MALSGPWRACAALMLLVLVAGKMDDNWLESLVDYLEFEYEDNCVISAEADWSLATRKPNALAVKIDADKSFGYFAKNQKNEVSDYKQSEKDDPFMLRKMALIAKSGDSQLESEQWNQLVSYADNAQYNIEYATDIQCKPYEPRSCTYDEYVSLLGTSRDRGLLTMAKKSWESMLPDEAKFAANILPLLKNASKLNDAASVTQYWEMMSEYPDGFTKAQQLWQELEPLYNNLQKYIVLELQKNNVTLPEEGIIPSEWLGSVFGEDWSGLIDIALPNLNIYQEINKNLKKKMVGERSNFKAASSLLARLGLQELSPKFWRESQFESRICRPKIVDFCKEGEVKVQGCSSPTLMSLMDAHDAAMVVEHAKRLAGSSSNSFIIREANRFSALKEAISELGSLFLLTPHQLDAEELLNIKISQSEKHQKLSKLTLIFINALRDLPRLAYYFTADKWRLDLLMNPEPIKIGSSWSDIRKDITKVSSSSKDYLGDKQIVSNKPYIAKFLGIILKYQLYDTLGEEMYDLEADIVKHVSQEVPMKLKGIMTQGFSKTWPEILQKELKIQYINTEPIIDYFQPLADFLEEELKDPAKKDEDNKNNEDSNTEDDDYSSIEDQQEENNPPEAEIVTEKAKLDIAKSVELEKPVDHAVDENLIKSDDISSAPSSSNLSNKNGEKEVIQEASSLQYVWIGLGVLILVIVILAVIIGRKRYKHKKELEKERREGAA